MTNNDQLALMLYKVGAIQFGEFTLKSGQISRIYLNLRKIISYPALLRAVAAALWEQVSACRFDVICGVPYTALPIATCIALAHDLPMVMRRKEKKEYGTKQMIEGVFSKGQRCLLIEDVITTGGSIIETAEDLMAAGLDVTDVAVVVDREQGGNALLSKHFRVHTALTLSGMCQTLLASDELAQADREMITSLNLTQV